MRLPNIFRRSQDDGKGAPEVKLPLSKPLVQQIMEAPVDFNRETRRRVGLYGRFWRWDLNAADDTRRTYVPRYIRRHYMTLQFAKPATRRQRRHRAVILRISRAKGIIT